MPRKKQPAANLIRGIPRNDYQKLYREVRAGKTTWAELEAKGFIRPSKRESEFLRRVRRAIKK